MKNCKSFEKQLVAYIHGELSKTDFQTLEKHLDGCDACRAELARQRSTLELLGQALDAAPAPERLVAWRDIPKRVSAHKPTLADFWYSPQTRAALITAAACSLFFVLSMSFVMLTVVKKEDQSFVAAPVEEHNVAIASDQELFISPPSAKPQMKLRKQVVAKRPKAEFNGFSAPEPMMTMGRQMVYSDEAVAGATVAFSMPETKGLLGGMAPIPAAPVFSSEQYDLIVENVFKTAMENPLSTFSIDVDRAAYANVRRFLKSNQLPPMDAVRIEELVNYFDYDYPQPEGEDPFMVSMEVAECPWEKKHQLALIGLQGLEIETSDLPPNNLVFLLDVSGSMNNADKLPLLKSAMRLLVNQLRPEDRVSIVVYAGAAGLVLEPTSDKALILDAIKRLNAGGSTAGGAGIELAYKIAKQAFIKNGNNRVILATDGDFNVGVSSDNELVRLIEKKRNSDIFLTVLGFGTGNYKDSKMEKLADKGNGNYAYIDDILEARKVLVNEMGGTLMAIAKDVKIQVEFNPSRVKGYRLIGYENRMLAKEDFNDDLKDAGELGAGHTVTALYELIPAGSDIMVPTAGDLKYQTTRLVDSDELMTVNLRYKKPHEEESKLIKRAVAVNDLQPLENGGNIGFASAVAEFGLLLRNSEFKGTASYDDILRRAKAAKGADEEGYRAEFIRLVEKAQLLNDSRE
ncbi:von Willebrand factor type A domain-containing protein [Pontiellaceae bacterium B12227]|nr:von Willebrand factor type A domain-containing protein [Pontiellaceae bacterium B12227]